MSIPEKFIYIEKELTNFSLEQIYAFIDSLSDNIELKEFCLIIAQKIMKEKMFARNKNFVMIEYFLAVNPPTPAIDYLKKFKESKAGL